MNYNNPYKNNSTVAIRVMCAIVFVVFSFAWLFWFQPDVLMMAQHVLSGGLTHYNRLIGAVIITFSLFILQLLVFSVLRLKKRTHALTYLPSFLLLAVISDVSHAPDGTITHGHSWWLILFLLLLWGGIVFVARMAQEVEDDADYRLFSRPMWINMLTMVVLIIILAWIGNTNAVFHYRMAAERHLLEGDEEGALKAGRKSLESDEHLLMLRMYALARQGKLGEKLFEYPITGTSSEMLPTDSLSQVLMYPVDSIYRFIGARPVGKMAPMRYLELVAQKDSLPRQAVFDYILCGYLIDKKIDRFASEVGRYYTFNDSVDSLPKHYREALTLYTHLRAHPVLVYHHAVTDEDYDNLQELEKQYPNPTERKGKVEDQYRGTYWYYYKYE